MLLSPLQIHSHLTTLISSPLPGSPHTALLISSTGQLLCWAQRHLDVGGDETSGDGEGEDEDEDEEEQQSSDEPWLDTPERMRLLLGLASQWEEDESPRVECEVC